MADGKQLLKLPTEYLGDLTLQIFKTNQSKYFETAHNIN